MAQKNWKSLNKEAMAEFAAENYDLELDTESMSKDEMIEEIESAIEAAGDEEDDSEADTEDPDPGTKEAEPSPVAEDPAFTAAVDKEYAKVFLKTVNGSRRNFTFKDRFGRDWSVVSGEKSWDATGPEEISAPLRKTVVRRIARNIALYAEQHPEPVKEASPTENATVDA